MYPYIHSNYIKNCDYHFSFSCRMSMTWYTIRCDLKIVTQAFPLWTFCGDYFININGIQYPDVLLRRLHIHPILFRFINMHLSWCYSTKMLPKLTFYFALLDFTYVLIRHPHLLSSIVGERLYLPTDGEMLSLLPGMVVEDLLYIYIYIYICMYVCWKYA